MFTIFLPEITAIIRGLFWYVVCSIETFSDYSTTLKPLLWQLFTCIAIVLTSLHSFSDWIFICSCLFVRDSFPLLGNEASCVLWVNLYKWCVIKLNFRYKYLSSQPCLYVTFKDMVWKKTHWKHKGLYVIFSIYILIY